ncbi:MAG: hypothetical protein JJU28_12620 [Cyclobacteriaceae bacterium]|nr:hypothetical protein [Cyclobacteriaceae bacterium]
MKKLYKKILSYTWMGLLPVMIWISCIDADDYDFDRLAEFRWSPELAIPMIYGKLTIENLLSTNDIESLETDAAGLYYLVYEDTLESRTIGDILSFNNIFFNASFPVIAGIIPPLTIENLVQSQGILEFDQDPEEITYMQAKEGVFNYWMSTTLNQKVDVTIHFPDILVNGEEMKIEQSIGGSNPNTSGTIDLSETHFDLTNTPKGHNQFRYYINAELENGNNPLIIQVGELISVSMSFAGIEYLYAEGYLGVQSLDVAEDIVEVGPYGDFFDEADIQLNNAQIKLTLINEFGVPVSADFERLHAMFEGGEIPLLTTPPSPLVIAAPSVNGQVALTQITINNAAEAFNNKADKIQYKLTGFSNPSGERINNFVAADHKVSVILDARVPLFGSANNINLSDTLEIDLDLGEGDVEIERALIFINIDNGFPLQGELQMYFTDSNYVVLDSAFTSVSQKQLPAARVDNNGNVTQPGIYNEMIEIKDQKLRRVENASHIIIKSALSTTRNPDGSFPHVKIKSDYGLEVNARLQAKIKATLRP